MVVQADVKAKYIQSNGKGQFSTPMALKALNVYT